MRKVRSNFYRDDAEKMQATEIKRVKRVTANLDYSGSVLKSRIRFYITMRKVQVCPSEKTVKPFHKIMQRFMRLLLSSELQIISRLNAINVRIVSVQFTRAQTKMSKCGRGPQAPKESLFVRKL